MSCALSCAWARQPIPAEAGLALPPCARDQRCVTALVSAAAMCNLVAALLQRQRRSRVTSRRRAARALPLRSLHWGHAVCSTGTLQSLQARNGKKHWQQRQVAIVVAKSCLPQAKTTPLCERLPCKGGGGNQACTLTSHTPLHCRTKIRTEAALSNAASEVSVRARRLDFHLPNTTCARLAGIQLNSGLHCLRFARSISSGPAANIVATLTQRPRLTHA